MIFEGGIVPQTFKTLVLGDAWQLGATWSPLEVTGAPVSNPSFAGYDAAGGRFAALAANAPVFLSTRDSAWTMAGPVCKTSGAHGYFYHSASNLLGAFTSDSLWTIQPGPSAVWSRRVTSGTRPTFQSPGAQFRDHARHRVLLFGGQTRYAYRVGLGGTVWSDEAWVDVPSLQLAFAGSGVVVLGALEVAFYLPVAGSARFEAFDVAGRRVAMREESGLEGGVHSIRLAPAGTLRPGVYFLRLTQNAVQVKARAILLPSK